jgi:hypothetical protein
MRPFTAAMLRPRNRERVAKPNWSRLVSHARRENQLWQIEQHCGWYLSRVAGITGMRDPSLLRPCKADQGTYAIQVRASADSDFVLGKLSSGEARESSYKTWKTSEAPLRKPGELGTHFAYSSDHVDEASRRKMLGPHESEMIPVSTSGCEWNSEHHARQRTPRTGFSVVCFNIPCRHCMQSPA